MERDDGNPVIQEFQGRNAAVHGSLSVVSFQSPVAGCRWPQIFSQLTTDHEQLTNSLVLA
jgi:hypothetical protein